MSEHKYGTHPIVQARTDEGRALLAALHAVEEREQNLVAEIETLRIRAERAERLLRDVSEYIDFPGGQTEDDIAAHLAETTAQPEDPS